MNHSPGQTRRTLLNRHFPAGVPTLWCPPITHYTDGGKVDKARTAVHLNTLAPHVKGLLSAGSTGDGWVLNQEQWQVVTNLAIDSAARNGQKVLVGVLKTDYAEQLEALKAASKWLSGATGASASNRLATRNICGFTVCPPRGAELTPMELEYTATNYLELGLPMALYQLPQVTQNELAPETVYGLALRYGNLLLFKDSSGTDTVAQYRKRRGDLFLLRGAEGDYAKWYTAGGGPYHGFLLSTANCFAPVLAEILQDLKDGRKAHAEELSTRLSVVVKDLFATVTGVKDGNPFANANKAADHFLAFGPLAATVAPPLLQTGNRLPEEVIRQAGEVLSRHGYMPARGYLE